MPTHCFPCRHTTVLAFVVACLGIVSVSIPYFRHYFQVLKQEPSAEPAPAPAPAAKPQSNAKPSDIPDIPRVHEANITAVGLANDYVRTGIPVIVTRQYNETEQFVMDQLRSDLLFRCGHITFPGIPTALEQALENMTAWETFVFRQLVWFGLGVRVPTWLEERRSVPLARVAAHRRVVATKQQENWHKSYWKRFLPEYWTRWMDFFAVSQFSFNGLLMEPAHYESCGFPTKGTKQEQQLVSDRGSDTKNRDRLISVYWRSPESTKEELSHERLYPYLHRDDNDFDLWVDVIYGCQEVVVVESEDRFHLKQQMLDYNEYVWKDDFWNSPRPRSSTLMWKGTVEAGETLFLPGDYLHEIRPMCPGTLSIVRRPWLARTLRYVHFRVTTR